VGCIYPLGDRAWINTLSGTSCGVKLKEFMESIMNSYS
jgi:hypothetical protein